MIKCPTCGFYVGDWPVGSVLACTNPATTGCPNWTVQADGPASTPVSVKHDSEKPAVQYIPMEALFAMGEAYGYGAKKYGGYNFQLTGLEVTRCLAAAIRHIFLFLSGEDNDKESGKSHLGHALAAIGMAIYTLAHFPSKDDRFKAVTK